MAYTVRRLQEQSFPLDGRDVFLWGGLGGALSVAVGASFFDSGRISELMNGSMPATQLASYGISAVLIALVGGLWATLNRPVHAPKIALQLGVIAPTAIKALIAAGTVGTAEIEFTATLFDGIGVAQAFAQDQPAPAPGPTTLDCIIGGVVLRPC